MKRILILSASAGAGHLRAAQAIESELALLPEPAQVIHRDALEFTNLAFKKVYSDAYIEMVNTLPGLLGLLYDYADQPWKDEKRRLTIDRLNTRALTRLLYETRPDHVICTHFLPAEIISNLICRGKLQTGLSIVVTDMDIHSMWLCRHYSNYFVALEETREHLKMLGFDQNRIHVSGIPIDPVFSEHKDKMEMRLKYGLDPDKPTIYMSSGGFGVGKSEEILASLSQMQTPAQVIAMCGRNQALKARLESMRPDLESRDNLKIMPVGYSTKVDEYMAASDLVLGKPGGLTTSEALAKGLAFVIVNPIPGQEERNADHLLERGIAIRCNNLPALAYKVDSLLGDEKRLATMQENAVLSSSAGAASKIVKTVFAEEGSRNHLQSTHRCAKSPSKHLKWKPVSDLIRMQMSTPATFLSSAS